LNHPPGRARQAGRIPALHQAEFRREPARQLYSTI
jgi:hypothetical protein